jgi:glycosyltransferase involved in cell wall biosynthesis
MLLSILIPTLENRRALFTRVRGQLAAQVAAAGLGAEVEILDLRDNGEQTTGWKRNRLLERAQGDFVAFVDDDDAVSDDYVPRICHAIRAHPGIDCIGLRGVVSFRGGHPREFIHSIRYSDWRSGDGVYQRPPYHLNPIRRSIAARYQFADVYYSEDIDWARAMARDDVLRAECFVDSVLYYYASRRPWIYQWALDHTETLRHSVGLRLDNRLRLRRLFERMFARGTGAIAAR